MPNLHTSTLATHPPFLLLLFPHHPQHAIARAAAGAGPVLLRQESRVVRTLANAVLLPAVLIATAHNVGPASRDAFSEDAQCSAWLLTRRGSCRYANGDVYDGQWGYHVNSLTHNGQGTMT